METYALKLFMVLLVSLVTLTIHCVERQDTESNTNSLSTVSDTQTSISEQVIGNVDKAEYLI